MVTIEKFDNLLGRPVTVDSGRDENGWVRGLTKEQAEFEVQMLTAEDPGTYYYVLVGVGATV